MTDRKLQKELLHLVPSYRIKNGKGFKIRRAPTEPPDNFTVSKEILDVLLRQNAETLSDLQDKLYAQARNGILIVFQAMDAAGKDGTVKHVMSGLNPQGCRVTPFKTPSHRELAHDYLWRCTLPLPQRGEIAIFNRSYYEEVLSVRVHPEWLGAQNLPDAPPPSPKFWEKRFESILNFEKHLSENGFMILKFFLHLSKKEQKKRFLERIDTPAKNWKFSPADLAEREFWDDYQKAYEEVIRSTSSTEAPWFVIPADNKSFARALVSSALIHALQKLKLTYPELPEASVRRLQEARAKLLKEE